MAYEAKTAKDTKSQPSPAKRVETAPRPAPGASVAKVDPVAAAKPATPAYQRSTTPAAQEKPATPAKEIAPGVIDLKGMDKFELPPETATYLDNHNKAFIQARFGNLAEGPIKVQREGKQHSINNQRIPLSHPFFHRLDDVAPGLEPCLIVSASHHGPLTGEVGFLAGAGLSSQIRKAPEIIGLTGFTLPGVPTITNSIKDGVLHLGIDKAKLKLASAFDAEVTLQAEDDKITDFNGSAHLNAHRAQGDLAFSRTPEGVITGNAALTLTLPKNFTGDMQAAWDGRAVTGEGKLSYQGEKLSGSVIVHLMEKSQAEQLVKDKKSPPPEVTGDAVAAAVPAARPKKVDYAIFGEGDLSFAFNEWLTGTAHAVVDPEGFVTLVTKITPQKELLLFETHPKKQIGPEIKVKATWGLPVIADVYIGAGGSLHAFADVKAVFQNMIVDGDYSTDPEKNKSFSLQGTLNVSAAAGLTLRLEVFAGLEILDHSIEAGGGLNGTAGIHGYVLATPLLGYREKGEPGQDKKGEFYIKGSMEVAAEPFLGLSGDVFIRLRTPWWSPLSDRDWPWELGSKTWPIGGSFGFGAGVEYVFGSGIAPELSFGEVDFSSEKLLGDLIDDKASTGSADAPPKASPWHEKNTAASPPPPPVPAPSKPPVKAPAAKLPPRSAKPLSAPKHDDPAARTASGKTVGELQQEAVKSGKKGAPVAKGSPKAEPHKPEAHKPDAHKPEAKAEPHKPIPPKPEGKPQPHSPDAHPAAKPVEEKPKTQASAKGVAVVEQALAHADKTGMSLDELNHVLKKVAGHKAYGFHGLVAKAGDGEWFVVDTAHPDKPIAKIKKSFGEPSWAHEQRKTEVEDEEHTLLFHPVGTSEELFVETSPMPLEGFLKKLEADGADAKKMAKIRALAKKLRKKKDEGIGVDRGKEIAEDMTRIADQIKTLFGNEIPPSKVVEHKTQDVPGGVEAGKRVKVAPLSFRPPSNGWTGSEPADASPFWKAVNQHKNTYVRGHLLNHHLFGPGRDFNMTPVHEDQVNKRMSSEVEETIKPLVLNENKVVSYEVDAIYGKWSSVYKGIPEENSLATGIRFAAAEMSRKKSTSGADAGDWEVGKGKKVPAKKKLPKIEITRFIKNVRAPDGPPNEGGHRTFKTVDLNLRASRQIPRKELVEAFKQISWIGDSRAELLANSRTPKFDDWEALRAKLGLPAEAIKRIKEEAKGADARIKLTADPDRSDLVWN